MSDGLDERDYGLWIGDVADDLLSEYRVILDRSHITGGVLDPAGNLAVMILRIAQLPAATKDQVIMDLLLTVANLESQILYYRTRHMDPDPA